MKENRYRTVDDLLAEKSFRRWVQGEASDDAYFWENWLAKAPERKALVEKAILVLRGMPFEFKEQSEDRNMVQEEWERLQSQINKKPILLSNPTIKGRFSFKAGLIRVAAAILLLVALGGILQNHVFNPLVSHRTPFGEQLSIILPDSTVINLNANSVLTYRKQHPRMVWLDGEAFFKVRKKPISGANFLVMTNDLTIEVLGTAFNVNEKASKTEVILEEGRIKLNLNRDFEPEVYMDPGELVSYSVQKSQKVEKRQIISEQLTSWKNGVLEFDDVPLQKVMERIEEVYGWRPVYQKETLLNRRISMGLPSNDLKSVVTMLSRAIGIEIEQVEEDNILLLH